MEKRAATPGCGTPGPVVRADNAPRWVIFFGTPGSVCKSDNVSRCAEFNNTKLLFTFTKLACMKKICFRRLFF